MHVWLKFFFLTILKHRKNMSLICYYISSCPSIVSAGLCLSQLNSFCKCTKYVWLFLLVVLLRKQWSFFFSFSCDSVSVWLNSLKNLVLVWKSDLTLNHSGNHCTVTTEVKKQLTALSLVHRSTDLQTYTFPFITTHTYTHIQILSFSLSLPGLLF